MLFRFFCTLLSILFFCPINAQGAREQKLQILATANTHVAILPMDPFSLVPTNRGWAKLTSAINAEKRKNTATILIDCGDTLQGTPLAYVQNKLRQDSPNPTIGIMNNLGYLAMVPGSHDYDFGLTALKTAEKQAKFSFIAANVVDSTGRPIFTPFVKTTIDGITVAFIGLFVPVAPNFLILQNNSPIVFRDISETAREWVPKLRNSEKADLVIAVIHTGSEGPRIVPNDENTAISLAEKVAGIDAIIACQSHQELSTRHNGTPIVQPSPYGQSIASITFTIQRQGRQLTTQTVLPAIIPLNPASPLDPQTLQVTESLRLETERYLNTFATQLNTNLDGRWSTVEPTPLIQLLHDVQRKATGAQLSATSSPGVHIFIPKGPTSVRQFYALAPHENRIARIRITGAQLRAYLEHAANYFNFSHLPELINRTVPLADYDMISGCSYALDISRPLGKRVFNLRFENRPVQDDQIFTMAISTYRLAGGGGYMEAIAFKGKSEMTSRDTLRNMLLEHVLATPSLNISQTNNWRTIPFLDRERVVAAQR